MTQISPFHDYHSAEFFQKALSVFRYQYANNAIYNSYCNHLKINADKVNSIEAIPFLPISFFKTKEVKTTDFKPDIVFSSSGTTGMTTSKHYVKDIHLYEESFIRSFFHFYGDFSQYCFLALLPNYLEREGSSLIYMMNYFIRQTHNAGSGFYLANHDALYRQLMRMKEKRQKTILFGVTYALLDFVENYRIDFPELIVFETGGMKGRRQEMVKEALHALLEQGFGVSKIHSEYGMCELLSQAYSQGDNLFGTPPWMRLLLRDEKDPFFISDRLSTGAINIIDFANLYSCAFIASDDLGKRYNQNRIEIIGRLDNSEIRGCNLLVWQ